MFFSKMTRAERCKSTFFKKKRFLMCALNLHRNTTFSLKKQKNNFFMKKGSFLQLQAGTVCFTLSKTALRSSKSWIWTNSLFALKFGGFAYFSPNLASAPKRSGQVGAENVRILPRVAPIVLGRCKICSNQGDWRSGARI